MGTYEAKRKQANKKGIRILIICAAAIVLMIALWKIASNKLPCANNSYQLSVLIDDTNPLNSSVLKRIILDIHDVLNKHQNENIRLNIFKISQGLNPNDVPASTCLPKACTAVDSVLEGCKETEKAKQKLEHMVKKALDESLAHNARLSPIAESIANIQGGGYLNSVKSPHSSLYIYSDMIQNTPTANFFSHPDFNYQKMHPPILHTDYVRICLIQRPWDVALQTKVIPVWKKYFTGTENIWDSSCTIFID